jgi:hypothetical protein
MIEFGMIDIMIKNLNIKTTLIREIMECLRLGYDKNRPATTFQEFFADPEWGKTKEVVVLTYFSEYDVNLDEHKTFHHFGLTVCKSGDSVSVFNEPIDIDEYRDLKTTLLWMGAIRNKAVDKYNLKLEEKLPF